MAYKWVVEQYFTAQGFAGKESLILQEVSEGLGFVVDKELFRGKIYDEDKLMTLIVDGQYHDQKAVLKIFALDAGVADADLILAFSAQNQSQKVRMAQVLVHSPIDPERGYGYVVFEHVGDHKFFTRDYVRRELLPSVQLSEEFCAFYQEYAQKSLVRPFFPQTVETEMSALAFFQRTKKWVQIAESKYPLPQSTYDRYNRFLQLVEERAGDIPMVFCHKHLDMGSIVRFQDQFILLSPTYFGYAPQSYDTTFHIWAELKEVRDLAFGPKESWEYVLFWLDLYQRQVSLLGADTAFEKRFLINMMERCIGALFLDIENQSYKHQWMPLTDQEILDIKAQIKESFAFIFDQCDQRLQSLDQ